ncbi:MAG: PorT family protein, partial [Prevotella sp.]|nr:PorT family protein [Prevotella sp.]
MKKILLVLCVLVSLSTQAQKNRVEHNLQASVGTCDVLVDGQSESGLMIKLGYGLNYYFSEQFSVMPGVAYREVNERGLKTCLDGSDYDHFNFIDIPIIIHYYLGGDKGSWLTFGLGPVFSFCVGNDT